jgi:hypothetical protein
MNNVEFQNFVTFLQDTQNIISNAELRRKAYYEFKIVYEYLLRQTWSEKKLIERHEYRQEAVFQNIAEGYFRLGFVESVFFEYAKLIYELWYVKTIEKQKILKRRIHKGTQIHQIAEIYTTQNKQEKAWNYYLAGLVEDVLEKREYSQSQAYRALRRQGLSENNLKLFVKKIKKLQGEECFNPLHIVETVQREFIVPTYEENESIDYPKLNQAKELWKQILKEK